MKTRIWALNYLSTKALDAKKVIVTAPALDLTVNPVLELVVNPALVQDVNPVLGLVVGPVLDLAVGPVLDQVEDQNLVTDVGPIQVLTLVQLPNTEASVNKTSMAAVDSVLLTASLPWKTSTPNKLLRYTITA